MEKQTPQDAKRGYGLAFALIVSLFFAWGIANSLNDILIPQFKKAFVLSDLQTGLVQSAFYGGYFLLAMPAAMFSRRFGYKAAVICGLCVFGIGALLFYPAAESHQYAFFLGALLVIASGLAFLETSANPLVASLGSPETSERRLNFAQAFNPLGVLSGVFIGGWFILSDEKLPVEVLAHAVVGPYICIAFGVLLWALLIAKIKFPAIATQRVEDKPGESSGFAPLFKKRHFLLGVMAQFFYVAAQVGVWSFTIRYTQHAVPEIPLAATQFSVQWSNATLSVVIGLSATSILLISQTLFMVGRFAGTALMGRIDADKLMAMFAALAVGLTMVATLIGGWPGVIALMAVSFFMSIMFPTIFAGAIRGLGPLTKSGSSFLVMAIIGGAVAPPIMGLISGWSSMQYAMIVPAICFAVILAYARVSYLSKKTN